MQDRTSFVVSHTTRSPREGEVDGQHYHFVEKSEMEAMIQRGEFVEHAEVHGNLYGTSYAAVEAVRAAQRLCVLDIDVQGVKSIQAHLAKGAWPGCVARFVSIMAAKDGESTVASKEDAFLELLEERLRSRGTEDDESIQQRLQTAKNELQELSAVHFDHFIVNRQGHQEEGTAHLREIAEEILVETSEGEPQEAPETPNKSVFGEFSAIARELGSRGVDLGQGFPNFEPPAFVVKALRDQLEVVTGGGSRTRHQYTRTAGHPPLVELLAERYSSHMGRKLDAFKEVAVTVGATNGLYLSLQAILTNASGGPAASEVVVLEPFFELYRSQVLALGATLRSVPMLYDEVERTFAVDAPALERALGPQTAAVIVNTPQNPTGKAFTEAELHTIAELVSKHDHIVVISDEVYKFMIFDPPRHEDDGVDRPVGHVHFARQPGMWDRTLTVSSAGKTFGITGWQIGWIIGPSKWMGRIHRFMPNLQFCAPTLMQTALGRVLKQATEQYADGLTYYEWLRQDYKKRRQKMVTALADAGIPAVRSMGGFFLLADISGICGEDGPLGASWTKAARPDEPCDWTFCRALAMELGVVALPVSPFFGPDAPENLRTRFIRLCFAKTDATLDEAAARLKRLRHD